MLLDTRVETLDGSRRLRVARVGSGPPLVLLHGYPDTLQIWCELAPRLADHFRVIAFDWPGMGESDPWPEDATPAHMAERLLALLDAWGIERASLAGMDMGGQPALVFAAKHPSRIRRLVVMNSLVLWDEATSWEIAILRKLGWNRLLLHFPPAHAARLHSVIPGSRLDIVGGAEHWMAWHLAGEVAGRIGRFLGEGGGKRP